MSPVPALALRMLRREWRAGELKVLAAALVIAVASVSGVGFFTDRMARAMEAGATDLLGADLLVESRIPAREQAQAQARALGLASARTVAFRSVVLAGDKLQLAEAKFVSDGYPLRGQLKVADAPYGPDRPASGGPARGEVWPDARIASLLEVGVGDRIKLGNLQLRIAHILAYEPDRGGDMFSIAPRVMAHLADLEGTGLVQPGSRVRYRLLLGGDAAGIDAMRAWLTAHAAPGEQVQGVRDARPEIRNALARAGQFLGLAALVAVLLAGVAVALSARRYAERHVDAAALLRCLGASQQRVLAIHALQLGVLGIAACAVGVAAGWAVQAALAGLISSLLLANLPPPSLLPALQGSAIGLSALLGFALPPLLALRRVPPARVLRRELGNARARALPAVLLAAATVAALVAWQARDLKLALYVLGGGALAVCALLLAAWLTVKLLAGMRTRVGVSWRFGVANVVRRAGASAVQVAAFGLGLSMLLLLTLVRADLLGEWQASLPPDAPNYFLVNVQPAEVEPMRALLADNGLAAADLYPMIRGRITAINARPVTPDTVADPRGQNRLEHGFNLSYASRLQPDNRVVAGRFWPAAGPVRAQVSIEQGIAAAMGLKLGDRLTFTVGGRLVDATLTSLREVEWDSFNVNFFVVTSPDVLADIPATYITSFHLPPERRAALLDLVRAFPTVTVIDVDAMLGKVREIMDRASLGVEYVFLFTLLAGLTVLYAAVQATLDERRYETAVLRTLGAGRRRVLAGLAAEFVLLGALAGLLAAAAATGIGAVVARQVLALSYRPDALVWVVGLLGGAAVVAAAGVLGTWQVVRHPPMTTLRE
jgi:putative ABC transport system permease protein